jgi:hypothetical protein
LRESRRAPRGAVIPRRRPEPTQSRADGMPSSGRRSNSSASRERMKAARAARADSASRAQTVLGRTLRS